VSGGLVHDALLYRSLDEYVDRVGAFVAAGVEAGEPVLVAVPGPRVAALRAGLNGAADGVRFADMRRVGSNPARIIPFVRAWVDDQGGGPARFVGEPIWPGRRPCEALEATRHESLINLAFADADVHIVCPYDEGHLDARTVADAHRTHPTLVDEGGRFDSDRYTQPSVLCPAVDLPPAPTGAAVVALDVTPDLARVRRFVRERAAGLLARARLDALLLAVNEAATNALVHGGGRGVLRTWVDDEDFVCEVADAGRLDDPLAGRRTPDTRARGGRGMWLINQLCDLVELHAGRSGTTLRLHMALAR
jgi:anti-sigma regulatory factor (Ser/Thr protein kinase)